MAKVDEVVEYIRHRYKSASVTACIQAITSAYSMIASEYPMNTREDEIFLTSGVSEYALEEDVTGIRVATYFESVDDTRGRNLMTITTQELDASNRVWRTMTPTRPRQIYSEFGQIGLVPAPNVTSAGSPSYPKIVLQVEYVPTLTLDTTLRGGEYYLAWLKAYSCLRYAEEQGLDRDLEYLYATSERCRAIFERSYERQLIHHHRQYTPNMLFLQSRTGIR